MKNRIASFISFIKPRVSQKLLLLGLSALLLLTGSGCMLKGRSEPETNTKDGKVTSVQSGVWEAEFSIKLANGKTENWIVDFHVNDDGKTVSSVELIHYIGVLTPGTNETALFTVIDAPIKDSSFEFSLTELTSSYSTLKYKGTVTFTSTKEASGTINISDKDYKFTAVPIGK